MSTIENHHSAPVSGFLRVLVASQGGGGTWAMTMEADEAISKYRPEGLIHLTYGLSLPSDSAHDTINGLMGNNPFQFRMVAGARTYTRTLPPMGYNSLVFPIWGELSVFAEKLALAHSTNLSDPEVFDREYFYWFHARPAATLEEGRGGVWEIDDDQPAGDGSFDRTYRLHPWARALRLDGRFLSTTGVNLQFWKRRATNQVTELLEQFDLDDHEEGMATRRIEVPPQADVFRVTAPAAAFNATHRLRIWHCA